MGEFGYEYDHPEGATVPVYAWTKALGGYDGIEESAQKQLANVAALPIIHHHVAAMPDVHWGYGATVGSVIPTKRAVIPAAVGVDIGCGMVAVQTSLNASRLPDNLRELRTAIEAAVPHGRSANGGAGDRGAWTDVPADVDARWTQLVDGFSDIATKHPKVAKANHRTHLGTLGTGNHFIEVCLDEDDQVWVMLHSGSRGVGNRIGSYFIKLAQEDIKKSGYILNLPDKDLSYFPQGTEHFHDYMEAVEWAQSFARINREIMLARVVEAMGGLLPDFTLVDAAINCHHNYVAWEHHYGENILITRKGAVRAREGDLGIIPGSMGVQSYIVRGKGNAESFESCSHGAGRAMSRTQAKKQFSVEDHAKATEGVECRKDEGVLDETPGAYKDIDAVMASQADLVDVVHTLKQVVCVKG